MNFDHLRAWAEIDLDAVENNYTAIREKIPPQAKLLAVMKADAYGHGAVPVARALAGKADFFAVAMVEEAIELRHAGITDPILILSYTVPARFPLLIQYDVRPAIFSWQDAEALNRCAAAAGKTAQIHIALDTGMSRIGFACTDESLETILRISQLPHLQIEGVFSHFANADTLDEGYTALQQSRFAEFNRRLSAAGVSVPIRHLCNSAGLVRHPEWFDMLRAGIILYGLYPSAEVDLSVLRPLRPVMSFRTHIAFVKMLAAGVPISYGCTFTTTRPTRVATVCVGYADGYPRALSNRWKVLIRGKEAPILGRVCMDQFMVDVTDIPEAAVGEVVTLFGRDGGAELTADQTAEAAGSIGYELICGIAKRIPRIYLRGGHVAEESHLLPDE